MMECVAVGKIAVGGEAGVVPVFDVASGDFVAASIGAFPAAAGLVVAPISQKFVAHTAIIRDPHADIGMLLHHVLACLLTHGLPGVETIRGCPTDRRAGQGGCGGKKQNRSG